jgi:hypothetical protein
MRVHHPYSVVWRFPRFFSLLAWLPVTLLLIATLSLLASGSSTLVVVLLGCFSLIALLSVRRLGGYVRTLKRAAAGRERLERSIDQLANRSWALQQDEHWDGRGLIEVVLSSQLGIDMAVHLVIGAYERLPRYQVDIARHKAAWIAAKRPETLRLVVPIVCLLDQYDVDKKYDALTVCSPDTLVEVVQRTQREVVDQHAEHVGSPLFHPLDNPATHPHHARHS